MDFFGIGPWEIILVLVIALIILGPGRLPEIARTLGRTVRALRKASADFTTAFSKELDLDRKQTSAPVLKEKKESETGEIPSSTNPVNIQGRDDCSTEPGGHRQQNE